MFDEDDTEEIDIFPMLVDPLLNSNIDVTEDLAAKFAFNITVSFNQF